MFITRASGCTSRVEGCVLCERVYRNATSQADSLYLRSCFPLGWLSGRKRAGPRVAGGKEIATQRTDDHGHFAFRQLTKGKYELSIRTTDFPTAVTQVVLVHPSTKSKKEIAVNLVQTLEHCWDFSIVNTKEFEAQLNQLNPDDSE